MTQHPTTMAAKIHYAGINQEVPVTADYCSILDTSIDHKIPHLHECGGNGKCTTCRVRILEGMHNISSKTHLEVGLTHTRKWDPSIRLACQSYVKGDIKVQRLIWSIAEVNKLQLETAPEGRAEERPIAIIFCDLRNFTQLSSQNSNFDIAWFLNRFYTELGDPILMNNGVIYQYVGDEIVGVFGTVGGERRKNATDALRAALGMQYALERLNRTELKDFDVRLEMGIGVHFGLAYVGYLGHPTFRQFSVIGDPVNVASRIQSQTKTAGVKIMVSDDIYRQTESNLLELGRRFEPQLRGKEEPIVLHELLGFRQMDLQLELQASLHTLLKDEDRFSAAFYARVFERAPELRQLFRSNMRDQGRLLTHMLSGIVYSLSRPEHLSMGLKKLGQNHHRYGVKDHDYPVIKNAMLDTIAEILGETYPTRAKEAWEQGLDFVISSMQQWKTGIALEE